MERKNSTYRMPEGFNLYSTADAVRGLTDAVHYTLMEGPGTDAHMSRGDRAGLNAMVELLQARVHELHDYLIEIENSTTLNLPTSDADFEALHVKHARKDEVKEEAAIYLVR